MSPIHSPSPLPVFPLSRPSVFPMIAFTQPTPFAEAIRFLLDKRILPTSLDTNGIRELAADVRQKSLFSARTTHEGYLQEVQSKIDGLLQGDFNEATARAELQDMLDSIGYTPDPMDQGGLKDLSSDKRVKLVLETNLRQAANFGLLEQGNDPVSRWQFPAFELVRIYDREEPRGEMPGTQGWDERWVRAGGTLIDGRLIALKSDPIWSNLGNSDLFEDGIDGDTPPYAFNSGMGWSEVPREEALELGLIGPGTMPSESDARFFDEDLAEDAAQFSTDTLSDLSRSLQQRITQLTAA